MVGRSKGGSMATDNRLRLTGVGLVLGLMVGLASAATAAIDMSGDWGVRVENPTRPHGHHARLPRHADRHRDLDQRIPARSTRTAAIHRHRLLAAVPSDDRRRRRPVRNDVHRHVHRRLCRQRWTCAYLAGRDGGAALRQRRVDAGETCDDHNFVDGDCCDSTCQISRRRPAPRARAPTPAPSAPAR